MLIDLVSDSVPQLFFSALMLLRQLFQPSKGISNALSDAKRSPGFDHGLRELISGLFDRASEARQSAQVRQRPADIWRKCRRVCHMARLWLRGCCCACHCGQGRSL